MNRVIYRLGEDKRTRLRVVNTEGNAFVITAAVWELLRDGERVDYGNCMIQETVLSAQIAPSAAGEHLLRFRFEVEGETFVEQVRVDVL